MAGGKSGVEIPLAAGASRSSPALIGDPYNPAIVDSRIKPPYRANPAHNQGLLMPGKTPEPADAASVYHKSAIRGKHSETFYGVGQDGRIYRYFGDNAGGVHFSGFATFDEVPAGTRKSLGLR